MIEGPNGELKDAGKTPSDGSSCIPKEAKSVISFNTSQYGNVEFTPELWKNVIGFPLRIPGMPREKKSRTSSRIQRTQQKVAPDRSREKVVGCKSRDKF